MGFYGNVDGSPTRIGAKDLWRRIWLNHLKCYFK